MKVVNFLFGVHSNSINQTNGYKYMVMNIRPMQTKTYYSNSILDLLIYKLKYYTFK